MESHERNNEDNPNWVDDVLSRAIKKSYEDSPKFDPSELSQAEDKVVDVDEEQSVSEVRLDTLSPYPDDCLLYTSPSPRDS